MKVNLYKSGPNHSNFGLKICSQHLPVLQKTELEISDVLYFSYFDLFLLITLLEYQTFCHTYGL